MFKKILKDLLRTDEMPIEKPKIVDRERSSKNIFQKITRKECIESGVCFLCRVNVFHRNAVEKQDFESSGVCGRCQDYAFSSPKTWNC